MGNNLRDIRRRIKSVKSTQQITRAMKMVAAAKFRRAEEKVAHAQRFSTRLDAVLAKLAPAMVHVAHPYLWYGEDLSEGKALVVLMTSDKGLCGSFNGNLVKKAHVLVNRLKGEGRTVEIAAIGKKGKDYFARRDVKIVYFSQNDRSGPSFGSVRSLAGAVSTAFLKKEYSEVYVVYSEFLNVTKHIPTVKRVLPVDAAADEAKIDASFENVILEPRSGELVAHVLDRYLPIQLLCALHINYASENGARMVAMDNATTAASDMIDSLTLEYNKARQSAITKELLEIVSGAEAMKT